MKNDEGSGCGLDAGHGAGAQWVAAPAKLNLYLHVLGRRDDGYHLLDSLMTFVHVGDSICAEPAHDLSLTVEGPFAEGLDKGEDNLVLRAARGLADACGVTAGARIRLVKNLPLASGLGGGSSDAAATLRALCHLWRLSPAPEDMVVLALGLGADVPFCLAREAGFVGGIGESLEPAAVPPPGAPAVWAVLINPSAALSTPEVFAAREGPFSQPGRFKDMPGDAAELAALLKERNNDLTQAAVFLVPEVGDVLGTLEVSGGCLLARMSGSGATCFGLFGGEADARQAAAAISKATPRWWVVATRLTADSAKVTIDTEIPAAF